MIPGGIGLALGLLFTLCALGLWSLAIWCAIRAIRDVLTVPSLFRNPDSDSGTVAVLAAAGFAVWMLAQVALA